MLAVRGASRSAAGVLLRIRATPGARGAAVSAAELQTLKAGFLVAVEALLTAQQAGGVVLLAERRDVDAGDVQEEAEVELRLQGARLGSPVSLVLCDGTGEAVQALGILPASGSSHVPGKDGIEHQPHYYCLATEMPSQGVTTWTRSEKPGGRKTQVRGGRPADRQYI
jgi:hypothetical protein